MTLREDQSIAGTEFSDQSDETIFERIKEKVEGQRYRLHPLFVRPTTYQFSDDDWKTVNEWKNEVMSRTVKVEHCLTGSDEHGTKRWQRLVRDTLGTNPRKQDIILFCIGDFILDMHPHWAGKCTLTLQKVKAAIGGRHNVTRIGRDTSTSFVDTCLDQSVAIQALALSLGIEGKVIVSPSGHVYWEEVDGQSDGSILDVGYGWKDSKGLFIDKEKYRKAVELNEGCLKKDAQ